MSFFCSLQIVYYNIYVTGACKEHLINYHLVYLEFQFSYQQSETDFICVYMIRPHHLHPRFFVSCLLWLCVAYDEHITIHWHDVIKARGALTHTMNVWNCIINVNRECMGGRTRQNDALIMHDFHCHRRDDKISICAQLVIIIFVMYIRSCCADTKSSFTKIAHVLLLLNIIV